MLFFNPALMSGVVQIAGRRPAICTTPLINASAAGVSSQAKDDTGKLTRLA